LYFSLWAAVEPTTSVVIGTDCIAYIIDRYRLHSLHHR
jgi:hypothetical protein